MTLERSGKDLSPLDAEIHSAILYGRDRGLRDSCELRQLGLAKRLQLPDDSD